MILRPNETYRQTLCDLRSTTRDLRERKAEYLDQLATTEDRQMLALEIRKHDLEITLASMLLEQMAEAAP